MKNEIGKFDIFATVIIVIIICCSLGLIAANPPEKGTAELSLENYDRYIEIKANLYYSNANDGRAKLVFAPNAWCELRNVKIKIAIQSNTIKYCEYDISFDLSAQDNPFEYQIEVSFNAPLTGSNVSRPPFLDIDIGDDDITVISVTGQSVYVGV